MKWWVTYVNSWDALQTCAVLQEINSEAFLASDFKNKESDSKVKSECLENNINQLIDQKIVKTSFLNCETKEPIFT